MHWIKPPKYLSVYSTACVWVVLFVSLKIRYVIVSKALERAHN